jgi:hypothetical protein
VWGRIGIGILRIEWGEFGGNYEARIGNYELESRN